nr:MAG TPA: hypothetical protein [Caudoviricetes sp.]
MCDNTNILYECVKVNRKEAQTLPRKELCQFGKEINHALVDINQPKEWLIEHVRADTGRYFDRSYLHKIQTGKLSTPGIVASIRKILDLPNDTAQ